MVKYYTVDVIKLHHQMAAGGYTDVLLKKDNRKITVNNSDCYYCIVIASVYWHMSAESS